MGEGWMGSGEGHRGAADPRAEGTAESRGDCAGCEQLVCHIPQSTLGRQTGSAGCLKLSLQPAQKRGQGDTKK